MIAREPDTKTRILDTAEKLFGENGFDATSLRDITAQADVNLAAVNYHFQSKDSLIDAVIARRIEPVNRRRLEMLEAAGPNPTIEQIVEAFLAPLTERDMGDGADDRARDGDSEPVSDAVLQAALRGGLAEVSGGVREGGSRS